jgi:U3 small nucleolar RNA-associated protein 10
MASLASQLQQIASIDASRLTSKTGAPNSKSYLFPPALASKHDIDEIFSLGQSGFEELLELDPLMEEFEDELFSEASKRNDRMMLNKEDNAKLDIVLERCLRRLGKWIGIKAGGKCIEWLVRRFRSVPRQLSIMLC